MRPERLWMVVGTGTEVGKTWVAADLLARARDRGLGVAARKPVQSFDPAGDGPTDADVLAAATGERADEVCPAGRWYPRAVAPPMAAVALGRPAILVDELVEELRWPDPAVGLGVVEGAGGLRSPLAEDGDSLALVDRLRPDRVVLVADAGLGVIHAVRSTAEALRTRPHPLTVVLNRYDPLDELHRWNLSWLVDRDGLDVVVRVAELLDRC